MAAHPRIPQPGRVVRGSDEVGRVCAHYGAPLPLLRLLF